MAELPDLSGSMRYKPELLTSEHVLGNSALGSLYGQIYGVDSIIFQYAYALEIIQPGATGKVAIRFLKRKRAGSEGRHPQIVQWYKSGRSGRFLYIRLKPNETLRKVKSYPIFAAVTEDVKILLREAIELMAHREKLLGTADNLRRQCTVMALKSAKTQRVKLGQVQEWLPLLAERREELKDEWREAVRMADEVLPRDSTVEDRTKPRIAVLDRTRGTKHETHKGNRE